ncbi:MULTISPECIES: hypothetical protein [Sorangium]|uniref:Uncharacterized protein n=1 Tax=Sorangium cellulosum TaxID=56 RepID=A0A4P2R3S9_SORCE|nr:MULTISPECIES: hypothetical protein [Sorangium]AUX37724.1 hypothetical protein SOCE836_099550 [Sorangium cellulosum]WCQ97011.1 hypothetical protein NQZ70_09802 [Sorangium sp. Soce836]
MSSGEKRCWLDRLLAFLSAALPFGLSLARAASSGQWREDLTAVRDLGLVAVGVGGGLSTAVSQALSLLPLGSRTFRTALGSALALALASRLLYEMVRRLLLESARPAPLPGLSLLRKLLGGAADAIPAAARPAQAAPGGDASPRLAAALSAIAVLTAALSPTWQREATVGGGAMLATCCALVALALASICAEQARHAGRAWIALGAVLGATFAESPPAGLAAMAASLAMILARRGLGGEAAAAGPPRRLLGAAAGAGALTAALLLAPLALRPLAPRAWADIGRALTAGSLAALDVASARTTALAAWSREIGVVSLLIAAAGLALSLLRPRARWLVAPFLVLLALDTLLPARAAGVLSADPLTPLRSLAVAAIAVGSALGAHAAVRALLDTRVPFSRSGAVLLVVFQLTLVALTSEEAGFAADRSEQAAAEVWTDEAYGSLDPSSAILVRSPAIAWRVWAARITRGERPDVLVVPIPLLDRGHVAASLLAEERKLAPLLRDFALAGEPTEFALSTLADVRPLYVELDPRWSKRLLGHLNVAGIWLEYAPQPLGPSDRKLATAQSIVPIKRVLEALSAAAVPDTSTATVLASTMRGQSNVVSLLGERVVAQSFVDRLGELAAQDPFVSGGPTRRAVTGIRQAFIAKRPVRRR